MKSYEDYFGIIVNTNYTFRTSLELDSKYMQQLKAEIDIQISRYLLGGGLSTNAGDFLLSKFDSVVTRRNIFIPYTENIGVEELRVHYRDMFLLDNSYAWTILAPKNLGDDLGNDSAPNFITCLVDKDVVMELAEKIFNGQEFIVFNYRT